MPNKINSNGIHANVKLMPSLSIWLFPHPILSSLTPSIAPLPDPLSILCDSRWGNLTWVSPSHPIIVTHSCSSAGTQRWRAADRFHCSTASSSACLRADIPALRDSPRLPYIHDYFHMLLPRTEAREITGRLAGSLSSACWGGGWSKLPESSGCKAQAAVAAGMRCCACVKNAITRTRPSTSISFHPAWWEGTAGQAN